MKKITSFILVAVFCITSIILPVSPGTVGAIDPAQAAIDKKADDIINTAISLIGKATYSRYVYQPISPYQFGCSGFIYYVFLQNGIDLNTRNTQFQAILGSYVSKDQLKKGDLVFFDSDTTDSYPVTHDGIYIGDNKIIHMADSISNVVISDLDSKPYYRDYYKMSRRVIPYYMPPINPTTADKIVSLAESLVGKVTYGSYNEATLTFNNPGFVYYLYKKMGVDLQTKYVTQLAKSGTYVPRDQLRKGDLVFFSSEQSPGQIVLVGIYAGNYNVIINAGSSTGVAKRFILTDYYNKNYVTARRIL